MPFLLYFASINTKGRILWNEFVLVLKDFGALTTHRCLMLRFSPYLLEPLLPQPFPNLWLGLTIFGKGNWILSLAIIALLNFLWIDGTIFHEKQKSGMRKKNIVWTDQYFKSNSYHLPLPTDRFIYTHNLQGPLPHAHSTGQQSFHTASVVSLCMIITRYFFMDDPYSIIW